MTAPLFHLSPGALDGAAPGTVLVLDGAEGHHAGTVMRLGVGEEVQLSDTEQIRALGVIVGAGPAELSIELREVDHQEQQTPRLVLVQALAKDKRDLQAVESATELGVDAVIPWLAERSVARWKPGKEARKHAEWVNVVLTAAKQARRISIPQVRHLHTTAQYLDALSRAPEGNSSLSGGSDVPKVRVVVLHEAEEAALAGALADLGGIDELHLVVGPEGGISDREIAQLVAAGAQSVRLGRNVLRSSTAGPAAIAGTQLLLGRWDWP